MRVGPFTGRYLGSYNELAKRNEEIARLQDSSNYQDQQRRAALELEGFQNQAKPLSHMANDVTRRWSQNNADMVAGVGLNHAANNRVDKDRMNRLDYYQNHSHTEALNKYPHSNRQQFNVMHDFYSSDPQRQESAINRATGLNLGEEERAWADARNQNMGVSSPLYPDYADNPVISTPGVVSGFAADMLYNHPTFAATGRSVGANRTALDTASELMNNGAGLADASGTARDIGARDIMGNYLDIGGINPVSVSRKAIVKRYGDNPMIKGAIDAFNKSKVGSKLDEFKQRAPDRVLKMVGDVGNKIVNNSANQIMKNQFDDFNRGLAGLPPELREEKLLELLGNSALGVIDDRIKKKYRGY